MNIPNIIMVYLCRNTHTSQRQGQYSYKIYISILAVALAGKCQTHRNLKIHVCILIKIHMYMLHEL